jgi:hypothetical protein
MHLEPITRWRVAIHQQHVLAQPETRLEQGFHGTDLMGRNALVLILAIAVLLLGAILLMPNNDPTTSVTSNEGTRVEAPGTKVESDRDKTRIQAPGVDITVPRDKDAPGTNDGD